MADVVVDADVDGFVNAKVADHDWEINVRAEASAFLALGDIRKADWNARRSIQAGRSAGADVFWSSDGDGVTIMIGVDDESWDLAVTVPVGVVDELVTQVARL